ncbi:MAG: alpha/beta hydrolase [Planctomycetes bacterium]|nr:alpha/beta hydrolase [Planctomycetota bacterium]
MPPSAPCPLRPARLALLALALFGTPLLAQASPRRARPPALPKFEIVRDERYAETSPDSKRNQLDLFLPLGPDGKRATPPPPLVMFVHGGGWMGGNKDLHRGIGERFAERGCACAVINYRLSPADKAPAHVEDCAAAFAWLSAHAAEFGYDARRMSVMGHSAGAHLVSLLALDGDLQQRFGVEPGSIRGVVALSGVYDVRFPHRVFEQVFGKEPRGRADASPIVKAQRGAPPFFLRWGQRDLAGLPLSATMFRDRLRTLDVEVDAAELRGEDHMGYVYRFGGRNDVIGRDVMAFLERCGKAGEGTRAPEAEAGKAEGTAGGAGEAEKAPKPGNGGGRPLANSVRVR